MFCNCRPLQGLPVCIQCPPHVPRGKWEGVWALSRTQNEVGSCWVLAGFPECPVFLVLFMILHAPSCAYCPIHVRVQSSLPGSLIARALHGSLNGVHVCSTRLRAESPAARESYQT